MKMGWMVGCCRVCECAESDGAGRGGRLGEAAHAWIAGVRQDCSWESQGVGRTIPIGLR
jgi:hypothetical protein